AGATDSIGCDRERAGEPLGLLLRARTTCGTRATRGRSGGLAETPAARTRQPACCTGVVARDATTPHRGAGAGSRHLVVLDEARSSQRGPTVAGVRARRRR